jgi:hypothetical protein
MVDVRGSLNNMMDITNNWSLGNGVISSSSYSSTDDNEKKELSPKELRLLGNECDGNALGVSLS